MPDPIEVQGLRELARALRTLDSDLPKMLRLAANEAAQLVVDEARPHVPQRSGKAVRSIKVASTRTAARVKAGSARVPYFGFLDFGGSVGPKKSSKRPFLKEGRYLWPAIHRRRQEIADVLQQQFADVAHRAGIEID